MSGTWNGKRVLVTGAGGFIASHLVESLVRNGATVRAFVRYNSRSDVGLLNQVPKEIYSGIQVIAGDLRDLTAIQNAAKGMETIFHLGALIAIPYSYQHPAEVVDTNVIGTLNILLAARDMQIRVIHTSTSEVYGSAIYAPIDEAHPLQGQSPYSASKIAADKLAESFYCSYDLPVVTVRPFNTYGPRQSARAIIPTIISQALTGSELHLGSLDTKRDFTYVLDTVAGFLAAAESTGVDGQTFNLGTGREISVGELVTVIEKIVGRPLTVVQDPERLRPQKSEVVRLLSDNRKAQNQLNWKPETTLESGLAQTVTWIQSNLQFYRPGIYQR